MSKQLYAKNKKDLARILGINHGTLLRLFERSDRPELVLGKGWLIEQWQRYVKANLHYEKQRTIANDRNGKANANLRDEAYIKRQELAADNLAFDLAVKRDKYTPKEETQKKVMTYFGMLVREGDKAFKHELPPRLEGMKAIEMAKVMGKRWDDIIERVAKSLESKNGHGLAVA